MLSIGQIGADDFVKGWGAFVGGSGSDGSGRLLAMVNATATRKKRRLFRFSLTVNVFSHLHTNITVFY